MLEKDEAISSLYAPDDQQAGTGASLPPQHTNLVKGSAGEENEFYRAKKNLYNRLKLLLTIFIPLFVGVMITLYIVYLQSINGPVNRLEVKTENLTQEIETLKKQINSLQEQLNQTNQSQKAGNT